MTHGGQHGGYGLFSSHPLHPWTPPQQHLWPAVTQRPQQLLRSAVTQRPQLFTRQAVTQRPQLFTRQAVTQRPQLFIRPAVTQRPQLFQRPAVTQRPQQLLSKAAVTQQRLRSRAADPLGHHHPADWRECAGLPGSDGDVAAVPPLLPALWGQWDPYQASEGSEQCWMYRYPDHPKPWNKNSFRGGGRNEDMWAQNGDYCDIVLFYYFIVLFLFYFFSISWMNMSAHFSRVEKFDVFHKTGVGFTNHMRLYLLSFISHFDSPSRWISDIWLNIGTSREREVDVTKWPQNFS